MSIPFIKAHAYGNDFLFIEEHLVATSEAADVARGMCDRRQGVGADGLIFFRATPTGAAMKLFNADGSSAEVSGNGVRCLAAIMFEAESGANADDVVIETDGGVKTLWLLESMAPRYTFRAFMGEPSDLCQFDLNVEGEEVRVVTMSVGNPQCIVLTNRLDESLFRRLGPRLAKSEAFPDGTNVEFVEVVSPDEIRILIWERGAGPTTASGTGACASAVAAVQYGGAKRDLEVISPGGSQRVQWLDDGIYLTGWATVTMRGEWLP